MSRMHTCLLLGVLVLSALAVGITAAPAFALSPSVETKPASNIDYSTVTLNGTVNPNSLATKTYFEYGPTTSYGSKTAEVSVGSGGSAIETAQGVTGLTPNTTYHYRIVATNASGTSSGGDQTFYVGWKLQTVASPETGGILWDVSCSSASECTAVGQSESGQAVAQRWNGSEWKAQTLAKPEGSTETALLGVSCSSSSACTAVGRYKNGSAKWVTLVEFWNGSEWKVQSSPNPEASFAELDDVSCLSSSECTAVGYQISSGPPEIDHTLALRWNGSEWKIQTTTNPSGNVILESVSCTSSTFCMAAGFYEASVGVMAPLSESWNGSEWTTKTAQKPAGATMSWLFGVSCTTSTTCTAVGYKEINAEHQYNTMAQRWNGSEWALQTTPNAGSSSQLVDVSCTSNTNCAAIGNFGGPIAPLALRWDGNGWTLQEPPVPASSNLINPFAISCIDGRGCEAVGEYRKNAEVAVYPLAWGFWRNQAPAVTTSAASEVGEKSATISGTINPNGSETKTYFEYGTTTSYGSKTPEVNLGSGTSTKERSESLTELSPNTTYHFRTIANNENSATGQGTDTTFTTIGPPTAVTVGAEVESSLEAVVLKGKVDPNGQSTTYQFECGTSSGSYSITAPIPAESAGSGTEAKEVSYTLSGLSKETKYFCRITASNAGGKVNGSEISFSTIPVPLTSPAKTQVSPGTNLHVANEGNIVLDGTINITCKSSTAAGKVVAGTNVGIWILSTLTFTECGNNTVTVVNAGTVELQATTGGNGTMKSTGAEVTVLTHNILGTVHCIYYSEGTELGVFKGSVNTGGTAKWELGSVSIPRKATDFGCGSTSELTALYKFTSPDYLDID